MDYEQMVQDVIDGKEDALKAYSILSVQAKRIKTCLDKIKPQAIDEAEDYEKNFELRGMKFERRSGGATYDFKHCETWNKLNNEKKAEEERLKQAYKAKQNGLNLTTDDGEIVELPKVKYKSDVLIFKGYTENK